MRFIQGTLLLLMLRFVIARGDEKSVILKGDHGDPRFDQLLVETSEADDAKSLREMIQKSADKERQKTPQMLSEIGLLKENLQKASAGSVFSGSLMEMLKEPAAKKSETRNAAAPIVGMEASEAIADPNVNVIDSDISEIINQTGSSDQSFRPDNAEMMKLAKQRHKDSNMHNLYRENLQIQLIKEEPAFKLGKVLVEVKDEDEDEGEDVAEIFEGVERWKVLTISTDRTLLIGWRANTINFAIGHNATYEFIKLLRFEGDSLLVEALTIWDSIRSQARNLVLVANQGQLIWHELIENDIVEVHRWNLLKVIDSMIHFTHDGNEILLVTTIDASGKVQAELIEFNVPDTEFWVVQAFTLPARTPSMTYLDLGKDLIVAFVQHNSVSIYRHQFTKHLRGKFMQFKQIAAANVTTVSGFRIGGHSYLAIGGDQPQIMRYYDGDFHQQTILSQTFGFVEKYLPIPIRTYRDDLVLLVQHRLHQGTLSIAFVDALIWNGIAFETAFSVPCSISADPNCNGFTCMIDPERYEGLAGAAFVHHEKENGLFVIIPRTEAHSGMFRIIYSIVEAEDPLMKEMEQIKKSIELINQMLDYEETVKKEVEGALKVAVNPRNDFSFDGLKWIDEIETDSLEFGENVVMDSEFVEFIDSKWTQADFLVDFDEMEKTIAADEQKLKLIDEELNKVNRINRQAPPPTLPDSQIYNIGAYTFNGQIDPKSIKLAPPQERSRVPRQIEPIEESHVDFLAAQNIEVETVNGIPFSDLVFLENDQLVLPDGNVTFLESIEVDNVNMLGDGRVNGIDFSQDVLAVDSPNSPKNLAFDHIVTQSLDVKALNGMPMDVESLQAIEIPTNTPQNLTAKSVFMRNDVSVETINGMPWKEFVDKLVPKHLTSNIDEMTVEGDLIVDGRLSQLNVATLNDLPFPLGYVLRNGSNDSAITGKKTFTGQLATKIIETDGTIDGISPSNMITLDQPQNIAAQTTFNSLEVIKKLEVNGTIVGRKLEDFLPNPTLEEVKEVSAACNFRELIVEGNVVIEESLNGQKLEAVLSDVVYETLDGSEVVIAAPKTFTDLEVVGDVEVSTNFISSLNLDRVMMTDREQTVMFQKLQGFVFFSNLKISGLFDNINATELEHRSIRTFGDQFIETPIIIREKHRVLAKSASIKESLNRVPVGDYLYIDEPVNLSKASGVLFNQLQVDNLQLRGDVVGSGTLSSLNLAEISTNTLSKSRQQNILAPARIKSLITNGTFTCKTINEIDFNNFIDHMHGIRNFKDSILSGKQKLNNLIIDGNVNLKSINDRDFDQIAQNAIWLNRANQIDGNLKFLDDVFMNGALKISKSVNRRSFKTWADNWISNQETPIVIHAEKDFKKDILIEEELSTEAINGIRFEDLLMVSDGLQLSELNVHGNVNVKKLSVEGSFNKISLKSLEDLYSYDAATYVHYVNTDVHFNQPASIEYLNTPLLNKLNVSAWMADMIRTDESSVFINGEKIFANNFVAQQGLHCDQINDLEMDFLEKVILITDQSIVNVAGDLIFAGVIHANQIGVKGDVYTRHISSCDTKEWVHHALPIDVDLTTNRILRIKSSALKPSSLTAKYLNGVPMASIFTLKTNQSFNHNIKVEGSVEAREPVIVKGLVNGLRLEHERENTVMRTENNQIVSVKTTFSKARVNGEMMARGKMNSKNIQNIILLNSSPTIDSAVSFRSLEATSIYTNSIISGYNFDKWYENVLWGSGKDEQVIDGDWNVKKLRLTDDTTGNGLINGVSIGEIENNLRSNIDTIETAISNHSAKYSELCSRLASKANITQNLVHILKHFELDFKLQESDEIFSHFAFETPSHENYIAVNTNCTTQLYKWQRSEEKFRKLAIVSTGVVYNWAMVTSTKNDVFIITNSRMEVNYPCQYGGLNLWKMNGDQMFHVNTISNDTDILELHVNQQQPGRFYTLDNLDSVSHFNVFGEKKEFWSLPVDHYNYSFLPPAVTADLTLFNGRNLFMLESKFKSRQVRFAWDKKAPRLANTVTKPVNGDSQIFNFKMPQPDARQHAIPSIPSTPLFNMKEKDFVTKIRDVGNAVRKSFEETFRKIPKVTIKNASNLSNEGKEAADKDETSPTRDPEDSQPTRGDTTAQDKSEDDNVGRGIKTLNPFKPYWGIYDNITDAKETIDKADDAFENKVQAGVDKMKALANSLLKRTTQKPKPTKSTASPYIYPIDSFLMHEVQEETASEDGRLVDENKVATESDVDRTEMTSKAPALSMTSKAPALSMTSKAPPLSMASKAPALSMTSRAPALSMTSKAPALSMASKAPALSMTPQILFPAEDEIDIENRQEATANREEATANRQEATANRQEATANRQEAIAATKFPETIGDELEPRVPVTELTGSGVKQSENAFFPERGAGEFVMMYIGPRHQKRVVFAVTRVRDSFIKGNHNIEIYSDIYEGLIYQIISCTDPSNLVSLQFRDETLFAFLESSRTEVQVYIYGGLQGFVPFKRIKLPGYAVQMTTITLPPSLDYKCDHHYLVVRMESEIIFYRVKISGNCGLDDVVCDAS